MLSFCLMMMFSASAYAANLNDAFKVNDKSNKDTLDTMANKAGYNTAVTHPNSIIANIIETALGLLGVIFILLIVYGGILWMTSGGEEQKIEKAQKIIKNAIIGLIITIAAYAISYFVIAALSAQTIKQ